MFNYVTSPRKSGSDGSRPNTFKRCSLQYATERNSARRVMATARVVAPCRATVTPMGGFSEWRLRREHTRKIPPRLLHSHYIWCACLLNSLLSEEIRSARYWPRWGYVDRAAVRYWGRGVRAPPIIMLHPTFAILCVTVCVCLCPPNSGKPHFY